MASNITKSRHFTFIIYPESIPKNWVECLSKLGVPMAVSPLHDMDEKKDKTKWLDVDVVKNGKHYKKAHYHVIYVAKNPVTTESVRKKIKRVLGEKSINHIEIVDDIKNIFLYLTHESKSAKEKKKYVYDKKDITYINDFDIDRYITLDEIQKKELFNAITKVIIQYKMENIFDLSDYILTKGGEIGVSSLDMMNEIIAPKTGLLRLYFDGAYQRRMKTQDARLGINPETGEIL